MAAISKGLERSRWTQRSLPFLYAFLVTLFALPASANIPIPDDPLTTGARVPPNILFLLDDSGSMAFNYMPDNAPTGWRRETYVHNTVFYNPATTYRPWVTADGSLRSGGTEYSAVYGDFNNASGTTIDLYDPDDCQRFNYNNDRTSSLHSSGEWVCGGHQTFYVPIDVDGDMDSRSNYYRYQIRTDGRVIRSEWLRREGGSPGTNNGLSNSGCPSASTSGEAWRNCTRVTPTGRSEEAERENYATWFSYHRTRMKAAKAGASLAFDDLGEDVRVGFRTIWRQGASTSDNTPSHSVPIPVNYNDGLFDDVEIDGVIYDNRSKWYSRLHSVIGYQGTPLHGALEEAGEYFSSSDATGPYGPRAAGNQLACRQNFTILTSDGYWNNSSNYSGDADNADGTAGLTISHGATTETYRYQPGPPYEDSYSDTLADVAMYFWKRDLRSDLDNIVPTTSNNPAFWQHMVTFGISIGLRGTLDPATDPPGSWPDPWRRTNGGTSAWNQDGPRRIDDLWHAAVNSRGSFVAASNPEEFRQGLSAALASIVEQTGSFTNVSANSTSLDTGTRLFQASYVTGVWAGDLVARPVSDAGIEPGVTWRASEEIPSSGRKVFTAAGSFPANLTDEQEELLERSDEFPVSGELNAAYLAGDRSLEMNQGGSLRNRRHLLGDIVTSSPAYVSETDTIYVGANDGMLHAFDASTGVELFAFIPDGIDWSAFGTLSRPDYGHRYFVDGPVVISSHSQTDGENILVGTLGRGGKGVFALDVSNPGSFTSSDVKWQHSETPGDNMGLVLGAPVIAKARGTGGTATDVVIIANGINSTSNQAALLVYDLSTGVLIKEIETGAGDNANPNGLSGAVGWDANADGVVDTVYAGDMLGNVWKFDLGGLPLEWEVANGGDPLFVATDDDGDSQPISARLTVGLHPANFQTWVFFGTGRFMTIDDVSDRSVQSLYGIRDSGETIARSSLEERSTVFIGTRPDRNGIPRPVRSFEAHQPLPLDKNGWYVNLLEPPEQEAVGERVISEVQVINRVLVAASIIPSSDACQSGGRGYLNALDAFTGTSLAGGSFFDVDGDGDFSDELVGDGDDALPVGSIDLGVDMPTLPNLLDELAAVGGSTGETETVKTQDARFTGRVSWREEVEE